MILLSVGTQLPFDRLVIALDHWAERSGRTDIVAQIGPAGYQPRHLRSFDFLEQDAFKTLQSQARLMVSHAGMGSIITALELGTPIIILPREHRLGEHRNGHQMATLEQFRNYPGIYAARNEEELVALLDRADSLIGSDRLATSAPAEFIERLGAYIEAPPATGPLQRMLNRWSKSR